MNASDRTSPHETSLPGDDDEKATWTSNHKEVASDLSGNEISAYAMSNYCPYRAALSGPSSQPEPAPLLPSRPQQQDNYLLKVFSSLYESGKYSDLVIKCQGQRWKAHRAVVCTQSRPLAAAIDGNFMESATGEIDLQEDDPQIIGSMLEYLYKGDISLDANDGSSDNPIDLETVPPSSSSPSLPQNNQRYTQAGTQFTGLIMGFGHTPAQTSVQNVQTQVQMVPPYAPVGYWPPSIPPLPTIIYPTPRPGVSNLFDFSNEQPVIDAPQTPATPPVNPQNLLTLAAIYIVADKYDVQPLKVLAKTKYESILATAWNTKQFVESLEMIYDGLPEMSEPDMLRDLAIKTAAAHAKGLMDREEFMTLFQERGDFATDVFKASLHQNQAQAGASLPDVGSGIPRCWINNSHAVNAMYAPRTYPGQHPVLRYKCAVCNLFID